MQVRVLRSQVFVLFAVSVLFLGRGDQEEPGQQKSVNADSETAYVEPLPEGAIARLGVTQFRASGQLYGMKVSPDGRGLATLNAAGTLRIWELQSGRLAFQRLSYKKIRDRQNWDFQFAISHDGQSFAMAAEGLNQIEIVQTELVSTIELAFGDQVAGIEFSLDDNSIIVASKEQVQAFSLDSGEVQKGFDCPPRKTLVAASSDARMSQSNWQALKEWWSKDPRLSQIDFEKVELKSESVDGRTLAVGAAHNEQLGNRVRVFQLDADSVVREHLPDDGHVAGVRGLQFVEGERLISSGIDNTARIWDVVKKEQLASITNGYVASSTKDGQWLAAIGLNAGSQIRLYEVVDSTPQLVNERLSTGSGPLAVSPAQKQLAYVTSKLIIEDFESQEVLRRIRLPNSPPYSLTFSADGSLIAMGAGHPHVWNAKTGEVVLDASIGSPHVLMFTPDARQLIAGGRSKGIHLWDLKTGYMQTFAPQHRLRSGEVMDDNRRLIGGCIDGKIRVWDLANGKLLATLPGHRRYVTAISIAPDGKTFASACIDSEILIWDATKLPKIAE